MSNKNKATHDGTCQVCGSYQKLPGNVLSKHGYTKEWFTATPDNPPARNYDRGDYSHDIRTVDGYRVKLNTAYAEQVLDKRASQLADYIKWQQERIKDWAPKPLKARAD